MVLFKINYWIKRKRDYQFTSVCRRFCGQTDYHFDSVEIAKVVLSLDLPPSKLDIITYEYILENEKYPDARHFVLDKLKEARSSEEITPKDVVLYGFGRIGRLLARELMSKTGKVNCD
jgi:glyceraldehyde 3-phosphate dehydrogenase